MDRTSNGGAKYTKALSERVQIFVKNDIEKLNLIGKEYFNFFIGKLFTAHEPWTHNLTLHPIIKDGVSFELELIGGIFQNFQVFHPTDNFWGHIFL